MLWKNRKFNEIGHFLNQTLDPIEWLEQVKEARPMKEKKEDYTEKANNNKSEPTICLNEKCFFGW